MFWASSQEVEEIDQDAEAQPLKRTAEAPRERQRIPLNACSAAVSNVVAIAIMISAAATLIFTARWNR